MAEQGEPFFDDGRSARFVTVFGSDSYAVIAHSGDEQYDEAQKVDPLRQGFSRRHATDNRPSSAHATVDS